MNQDYEKPLAFTSNKQSKLYFSQVSKYPCNSQMILTTHKYKKLNLPINKKIDSSCSRIVIKLINFMASSTDRKC